MNSSHHGSDEQMFGAKQQVPLKTSQRSAGLLRKRQSVAWAYKTGMGPITKLYWRRLNTQFTTGVSKEDGRTNLLDLSIT